MYLKYMKVLKIYVRFVLLFVSNEEVKIAQQGKLRRDQVRRSFHVLQKSVH